MFCPICARETPQKVLKTERHETFILRRRKCERCNNTFPTRETIAAVGLNVVKSDDSVVSFDPEALREVLNEATAGRHSDKILDQVIDEVFQDLYEHSGGKPVPTSEIGDVVLRHLKELNAASHIRFALGWKGNTDGGDGWEEPSDFRSWLYAEYPELDHSVLSGGLSWVVKRHADRRPNGAYEPYSRTKLVAGVEIAAKGRGSSSEVTKLANRVADEVETALENQVMVTSGQIASEVLKSLRERDQIAFLRYAAPAKKFRGALDYANELSRLRRTADRSGPGVR